MCTVFTNKRHSKTQHFLSYSRNLNILKEEEKCYSSQETHQFSMGRSILTELRFLYNYYIQNVLILSELYMENQFK